ncbi:alanine/glycine:cation symporter family protein [Fusibacter ferrireducens]|nr:amino acid carrier protein [Fusibacter ferrireducens]
MTQATVEYIVWEVLWGTPLIITILAIGLYLTYRTGFFQFRFLKHAMGEAFKQFRPNKMNQGSGVISSFQAMSLALGATVGVGNIGGVAAAIAIGGPGAIFWMWIVGLLGMIIKLSEITLAVHYRSKNLDGSTYGGPNYYMKKGIGKQLGLKKVFKSLSALFAFGFLVSFFINIQIYTVAEAISSTFNTSMMGMAIVFTIILYIMISGGLKGLGKIAGTLVPFMVVFYLLGGLFIIVKFANQIPSCIGLIFSSALTGTAAIGGFGGAAFAHAIKTGMARSVFSNEAGWGSAPMVHASAKVDHPVKQGVLGIFEVMVDTLFICSITALVIMVTGEWSSGLSGAALTLSAFETGIGNSGRIILALGTFLFGITTASGIYAQMEVVLRYLLGESKRKDFCLSVYKWLYPLPGLGLVIVAVYFAFPGTTVWLFSDMSTALPIFANVVALAILSPKVVELLNDYKARYLGFGKIDPKTKLFYEDSTPDDLELLSDPEELAMS